MSNNTAVISPINGASLADIAGLIRRDWQNISPYAAPYVDAMSSLNSINDTYITESANSVVLYFLANAGTWRGDTARAVKAYLKKIAK
jgi:hypothetical protein